MWPFDKKPITSSTHRKTVVATARFSTNIIDAAGKPTGQSDVVQVVVFEARGDKRTVTIEGGNDYYAEYHAGIVEASANWRHHGELPTHAKRVVDKGNVVPLSLVK